MATLMRKKSILSANYHKIRLDFIVGICWILIYNKTVITVLYKYKLCHY